MEQESSGLSIRRIVTGHNDAGKAVVAGDEQVPGTGLAEDSQSAAVFFHLWATHEMPVDLSDDAAATQREGSERTTLGSGSGSVLRIGVLPAGTRSPMHRTESLDYGICLEGECDMELDGGEVVSVHAGDVVVQRGTNHVWHNHGKTPCRFAWILLDAKPVTLGDTPLGPSWQRDADASG
jgi:quercetin dioxygenase-like cupin family protein